MDKKWSKSKHLSISAITHLRSVIPEDGKCMDDIKQRIGCAMDAFNKRKELLSKSMNKPLKKRVVKALVWSVALYGCETWVMKKEAMDRLEAFEIWVWRRLEKESWESKMSNEKVLEAVVERRRIVETIVRRKKNWIGHVVRRNGLLKLVLEGRMENKRARGKPRIGMIDDLMEGSYVSMKRRAEDREEWRSWLPRTCRKAEN